MEWVNNNTGILIVVSIAFAVMKFLLLRWQGYEQSRDLRAFLFWHETGIMTLRRYRTLAEQGVISWEQYGDHVEQHLEEMHHIRVKGSKHRWIENWRIWLRRKSEKT